MGDMGFSVAKYLTKSNYSVLTNIDNRSEKSKNNAKKSNSQIVSFENLILNSQFIISIIPPSASQQTAKNISFYSKKLSKPVIYIDANAISPKTTLDIENDFYKNAEQSSIYIDGSIIGGPPNDNYKPNLYLSGKNIKKIDKMKSNAFNIINLGEETKLASSLKMCYASWTKGSSALIISMLLLAEKSNVLFQLLDELNYSQKELITKMIKTFPSISEKSYRWIAEMEEIASTYYENELNPGALDNASSIYKLISRNKNKLAKFLDQIH